MMTNVSRAGWAALSLLVACARAEGVTATGDSAGAGGSRSDASTVDRAGSDAVDGATSSDAPGAAEGNPGNASILDGAPGEQDAPRVDDAASSAEVGAAAESGVDTGPGADTSPPNDGDARGDATESVDAMTPTEGAPATVDGSGVVDAVHPDGPVPLVGLVVTYRSTSAMQVQFDVHVTNTGAQSQPSRTLVVRYYLTGESTPRPTDIFVDSAAWQSTTGPVYYMNLLGSCSATYGSLSAASDASADAPGAADATPTGADAYVDLTCSVDQPLTPGASLNLQVRVTGSNPTNDYSYQPGDTVGRNERIVVLQSGAVIAGKPPP